MPLIKIGQTRYIWKGPPKTGADLKDLEKTQRGTLGMGVLNPIQCYRKVTVTNLKPGLPGGCECEGSAAKGKWKTQEVFTDAIPPGSTSTCVDSQGNCLLGTKATPARRPRIKSAMLQNNAQLNTAPRKLKPRCNNNYQQYLQSRCKTFYQNTFNYQMVGNTGRSNCAQSIGGEENGCSCASDSQQGSRVTYKPSNKKYSTQGAVSSSARLDRLKYNTAVVVARSKALGGAAACPCPLNRVYPPRRSIPNNMVKSKSLTTKKIYKSGGCGLANLSDCLCLPGNPNCCPKKN